MHSQEFIFAANDFINYPEEHHLNSNFSFTLPFRWLDQLGCREQLTGVHDEIREFYFDNATIDASQVLPFVQLASFNNVAYPILKEVAIQILANSSAEIRVLR